MGTHYPLLLASDVVNHYIVVNYYIWAFPCTGVPLCQWAAHSFWPQLPSLLPSSSLHLSKVTHYMWAFPFTGVS